MYHTIATGEFGGTIYFFFKFYIKKFTLLPENVELFLFGENTAFYIYLT